MRQRAKTSSVASSYSTNAEGCDSGKYYLEILSFHPHQSQNRDMYFVKDRKKF